MNLFDVEIFVQGFVNRQEKFNQPVTVPGGKGGGHIGVFCHAVRQAHGHVFFRFDVVQKKMILVFQPFCLVHIDEAVLKSIGNGKQGQGSHEGEEKERNDKLPLETDIVKSREIQSLLVNVLFSGDQRLPLGRQ